MLTCQYLIRIGIMNGDVNLRPYISSETTVKVSGVRFQVSGVRI